MIPYRDIDTLFLDVGNTLISIDFNWVAEELTKRGLPSNAEALRRAEAGARPGYAHGLFVEGVPPGTDFFRHYLKTMLVMCAGDVGACAGGARGAARRAAPGAAARRQGELALEAGHAARP